MAFDLSKFIKISGPNDKKTVKHDNKKPEPPKPKNDINLSVKQILSIALMAIGLLLIGYAIVTW